MDKFEEMCIVLHIDYNVLQNRVDFIKDRNHVLKEINNFKRQYVNTNLPLDEIIISSSDFAKCLCIELQNQIDHTDISKIFLSYFEFAFNCIKFKYFRYGTDQFNDHLLNMIRMFTIDLSINWWVYQTIRQEYLNTEELIERMGLVIPIDPDDFYRFRSKEIATYHFIKHTLQDMHELGVRNTNLPQLTPVEYLFEANHVLPGGQMMGRRKIVYYYLYEEDTDYREHYRFRVRSNNDFRLFTYYKLSIFQ